jgi:hypothetical protein
MTTTFFAPPDASEALWGTPSLISHQGANSGLWGATERNVEITSADDAHFGGFAGNTAIMLMGRRGNGKTLLEDALADQTIRSYETRGYPGRVFTNLNMSFLRMVADDGTVLTSKEARDSGVHAKSLDIYSPYLIEDVQEFPDWFRNGYVVGDEVQTMASGRRSMSKANVNLSQFLTQMRHRDIDAIFTTQFPQVIDYQLLLQVDLFVKVHIVRRRPYPPYFPWILEIEIWDWWGQLTGKDWRKTWPPTREDIDGRRRIIIPERLMGTYSTKQIIASVYWDKSVRERVNIDEELALGGHAEWMQDTVEDEREQVRDEQIATAAEQAQDAYQEDPSVRFADGIETWAGRMGKSVNVNAVLVTAQIIDPSIRDAFALAEVFKSLGYTITINKVGGGKTYLAVKE